MNRSYKNVEKLQARHILLMNSIIKEDLIYKEKIEKNYKEALSMLESDLKEFLDSVANRAAAVNHNRIVSKNSI